MVRYPRICPHILELGNGRYYTGIATDIKRRFTEHCLGKGSKLARGFGVKRILQKWEVGFGRGKAMKIETFIKKQNRETKEKLIKFPRLLLELFNVKIAEKRK